MGACVYDYVYISSNSLSICDILVSLLYYSCPLNLPIQLVVKKIRVLTNVCYLVEICLIESMSVGMYRSMSQCMILCNFYRHF